MSEQEEETDGRNDFVVVIDDIDPLLNTCAAIDVLDFLQYLQKLVSQKVSSFPGSATQQSLHCCCTQLPTLTDSSLGLQLLVGRVDVWWYWPIRTQAMTSLFPQ